MLFLMNDVVFQLDGVIMEARLGGERLKGLTLPSIIRMGQELYAAEPLLHRLNAERARRLAALICGKAPTINAALFTAPAAGCDPHEVQVRFVAAQFEVMAELYNLQRAGELDALRADSKLWRRLAA
ncbi:MAG TPA: hypothetical protein VGC92_07050 [Phenylobacterium sp.]|jgi:hypothetical protein